MITWTVKGDLKNTITFLNNGKMPFSRRFMSVLKRYGERGVAALESATPRKTGKTAKSWKYKIETRNGSASLVFYNENIQNGVNIAVILQYGHGTRNGGYVQGQDYINPAIKPVFDDMIEAIWKEVK